MASYDDTATVSGSVVSFSDGADEVGLKSCVISLPASLSGYTEASVVKARKNLFDGFTKGYGLNSNTGKIVETPSGAISGYIPVKEETNYYLSGLTDTLRSFIAYYKADKTYISRTGGTKKLYAALTTPSECAYAIVYQYVETGSSASIDDVDNLKTQLEVGSSASSYEPYTEPTTYTANLGRTVYGADADLVSGQGRETYGYIVFDGSDDETWYDYANYEGYSINIATMKVGNRQDGVCNQLTKSTSSSQGQSNVFWLGVNTSRFYVIGVYQSMGSTLEAFKAYLAENPLILVYPLATPTDFTFDPVTIETSKGSNTFWSDQGNTELTYYKDGYGTTSVTVHKETPDGEPVEQTAKLHKVIYAGEVDVIKGTAKPKNLMIYPYATESGSTSKNIEFTFDDKGIIHLEGEHSTTGNAVFYLDNNVNLKNLASGKYVFSQDGFNFTASSDTVQLTVVNKSDDSVSKRIQLNGSTTSKSFVVGDDEYIHDVFIRISPHSVNIDVNVMLESGETETTFAPYFDPFTFPPISMETDEGENTLFADEGDSAITYRKAVD